MFWQQQLRKSGRFFSCRDLQYKIQLLASSKSIPLQPSNFKGLNNVKSTFEADIFRYTYGETWV
jgi:N-acetylmuramoyl-L-alanine amidase